MLGAILIATLVDQGLLSYDDKVSKYWPEFAQNGKEDVTVAQVMRHECGLQKFDTQLELKMTSTDNVKKNSIGSIIEKQKMHKVE